MATVRAAAVACVAVGTLWLVAHDGSPGWRVARAVVVLLAGAALLALAGDGTTGASRRLRGLVLVPVGAVGLAAGIGIVVPYLTKDGWSLTTLAGLLVLVGGAALLVLGTVDLCAGAPSWVSVVVVLPVLVVTVVAVYSVGQAVAVTNVPPTSLAGTTPAERGVPHEEVSFRTADGVELSGWYVPSENGAAVVLLHGAGSTRSSVLDHAEVLAGHGYGVLLYDARGHGRSGGRAMDFGWYGDADVRAAVDLLADRAEVRSDGIGLVGLSKGGEEALGAAASDERVRAVVAEGVGQRVAEDKDWLSERHGWRGSLQERLEGLTFGLTDVLTEAEPPITLRSAVAAAAPTPVLLVTAGEVPDELHAAEHIAGGSPGSVQVWTVRGAGHTDGLDARPVEWESRIVSFLDEALLDPGT